MDKEYLIKEKEIEIKHLNTLSTLKTMGLKPYIARYWPWMAQ